MTFITTLRKASLALACTLGAIACLPYSNATTVQDDRQLQPFTVRDAIERSSIDGVGERRLSRSPDGRRFAFVTSKGDLAAGMVRSTVWIVSQDTTGKFAATAVAERASGSNDAPVSSLRWVDRGSALAFLSPDARGVVQVFRHDLRTGRTRQITQVDADVNTFDLKGDVCVFFATAKGNPAYPSPGGYLKDESLSRLIFPEQDNLGKMSAAYLQRGKRTAQRITEPVVNLLRTHVQFSIAPAGDLAIALLPAAATDAAFEAAWNAAPGAARLIDNLPNMALQVYRIDVAKQRVTPLLSAPTATAASNYATSRMVWSPDGTKVIVTNTLLGPRDLAPGASFAAAPQTVELQLGVQAAAKILPTYEDAQPGERIAELTWNHADEVVAFSAAGAGGGEGLASMASQGQRWKSTYVRTGGHWRRTARTEVPLQPRLAIGNVEFFVDEDANTPPRIVGLERGATARQFEFDPHPRIRQLRLLPVRAVGWTDQEAHQWSGGLIIPQTEGLEQRRWPVVIALKFFDPSRFSPDGPYTTAFASQALAAKGIAVLELNAFDGPTMGTAQEGPMQMRGIESAIDFLAAQYHIDPERVGLIGFSRTCYHVSYALTHSRRRFAAATIADGLSGGYLQYHAYSLNHSPGNGIKPLYDGLNSGPPWGENLQHWLTHSPDMNAGKISAPVRIEMLGKSSVLQEWELYSSLKLQGKPVDVLYLPDATHVLIKPQERYLSQQGNVNWFSFWLLGATAGDQQSGQDFQRWKTLKRGS